MELTDDVAHMETNELKLLDFPNEILLEIFCNLGDISLLQVIGVCKRFDAIAAASFTKKYSGASAKKFYSLIVDKNHWLITIIQRYCKSITKVKIRNGKEVDLHSIIGCMSNLSQLFLEN